MKIGVYQEEVAHVDKDFNVSVSKNGLGYYQPVEISFQSDIEDLKQLGATNIRFEKDKDGVKEVSYTLLGNKYKLKRIEFISEHAYDTILKKKSQVPKAVDFSVIDRIEKKAKEILAERDPTKKEKLRYYKKRINDQSLTSGQRKWALKRVNELQINL